MGEVRERMEQDLFLRGVAASTRETCLRYAQRFVALHVRDPRQLDTEHVRAWVIPGCNGRETLTREAVHKLLRLAAARAGITKRVYPHLLRHSFAT